MEDHSPNANPPSPPPPLCPLVPIDATPPPDQLPPPPPPFSQHDGSAALVVCDNCAALGHMKRNCPQTKCNSCGHLGHFKQDCPQEAAKRRRTNDDGSPEFEEDDYRWSVCRGCGSSRHIQANCPVRYQTLECYQCHQRGHMMTTCPQTRCYNCGTYGHSSQVCHSKLHCFHCSHAGHRSSECPMKSKGRVCYQCNEPGHEAANCPQGQLCRMCHRPGHLVAHCPEVKCNACNEKGHTAGSCSKGQCGNCGGAHETIHCTLPQQESPAGMKLAVESRSASSDADHNCNVSSGGEESDIATVATTLGATSAVPTYAPTGKLRAGRVAVVIDGPYFERCLKSSGPRTGAEHYTRTTAALRSALQFIGDICGKDPVGYWFDTDPTAFTEFLESAVPLHHREHHFRECSLRKRFLTDEMNGGRSLHNVIARLVGGMKQQKGYTQDGPGFVWVQSGVDVAIATCVVELFNDRRQFQQVVLLCGDSDVYPAVHYCNTQRRVSPNYSESNPVRVCGTSSSISKLYGQHQDLSDFLPSILLDSPDHVESGITTDFVPASLFA